MIIKKKTKSIRNLTLLKNRTCESFRNNLNIKQCSSNKFGMFNKESTSCSKRMSFRYQSSTWIHNILASISIVTSVDKFSSFAYKKITSKVPFHATRLIKILNCFTKSLDFWIPGFNRKGFFSYCLQIQLVISQCIDFLFYSLQHFIL